jgi:acyl transferase domain-containing protein
MSAGTAPQVAVIGMAARLPGADTIEEFWRNLLQALPAHKAEGPDVAAFDAGFFGIDPGEAALMDPQHRMFLECCWNALEDAGHDPVEAEPLVRALYGGCSLPAYLVLSLAARDPSHPSAVSEAERRALASIVLANDPDALTARTAYHLDLRGACLTVQAYSATGLVAVHLAAQALLLGECDLAIAGAASVRLPELGDGPVAGSRTGVCAPLDAAADGILPGSGVGVVVLRRLDDALADGDHIRAVLAGTAVTHDGGRRRGYLLPGTDAKAEAIAEALAVAGLDPSDLGYIEAQAAGDPIGDAVEVAALDALFCDRPANAAPRLGAVAANVGHLDAAAGPAGLIKAVLMVERGWIPPQPSLNSPSTALARARARFRVSCPVAQPWTAADDAGNPAPRRAGVDSFGIGGATAHAVVCQAPEQSRAADEPGAQLFVLSAHDDRGLRRVAQALHAGLADMWSPGAASHAPQPPTLADAAYTLQIGRAALPCRAAFRADSRRAALDGLRAIADGAQAPGFRSTRDEEPWDACARAWLAGEPVDWRAAHTGRPRRRVPLPGYPFDRHRFWTGAPAGSPSDGAASRGEGRKT